MNYVIILHVFNKIIYGIILNIDKNEDFAKMTIMR